MKALFFSMILALTAFPVMVVLGQQKYDPRIDNVTEAQVSAPIPVVFGKKDDGLPEQFKARGVISAISFSRACGVVLWSGTLKIKLMDKIEGYPYENVFVVVNCLEDFENAKGYLNKTVEIEVSKLYPEYRKIRGANDLYFELIDNTIKSGCVPFYITNMGRWGILKNIELHERQK
jgi:hypothetical protein